MTWTDLLLTIMFGIGAHVFNKMENNYVCPIYCGVEHKHNYVMNGKGDTYRVKWSKEYAEKYEKIFKGKKQEKKCQSLEKEVKKD